MATEGTNRDFSGRIAAPDRDEVWRRWITPATWGDWDKGLRSAEMDGPFVARASGVIVGLDGRRSRFAIVAVEPGESVHWEVALPLAARMALTRTLTDGYAVHRVQFLGAGSPIWAALLGRRFRRLMEPTMQAPVQALVSPAPPAVQRQ